MRIRKPYHRLRQSDSDDMQTPRGKYFPQKLYHQSINNEIMFDDHMFEFNIGLASCLLVVSTIPSDCWPMVRRMIQTPPAAVRLNCPLQEHIAHVPSYLSLVIIDNGHLSDA